MTGSRLPLCFGGGRYTERPPVPKLFFQPESLSRPLSELERVTPAVARKLTAFGLVTVGDLIDHFPRRYEDFRDRKQIRDLKVGEEATIRATVVRVTAERTARRRVDVVKVLLRDDTGAGGCPGPWRHGRGCGRPYRQHHRPCRRGRADWRGCRGADGRDG